jgi:hypothetical protein
MRKLLYITALLFSFQGRAQSIYYPLPDSNAMWTLGLANYNNIFIIKGDSAIGGFTYKKYFIANSTNLALASLTFVGLVRQETSSKKIFAIKSGTSAERLIYNFNLNINDTVRVRPIDRGYFELSQPSVSYGYKLKVIQKDSILILGQYRKRLHLVSFPFGVIVEKWIEGIGSDCGILNAGSGAGMVVADICIPLLLCHKKNDTLIYMAPNYTTCEPMSCPSSIKINYSNNKIVTYPQPVKDVVTIQNKEFINQNITVNISNSLGTQCVNQYLQFNNGTAQLPLANLPKGIYLLKLIDENLKTYTQKLILE